MNEFKLEYLDYRDITVKLKDEIIQSFKTTSNTIFNDIDLINEDIRRITFGLEDLNSNLMTTDNYLDKYLPFRLQNFISETLENILSEDSLAKLKDFEKVKYKHMHEKILVDEGVSQLKKSYENTGEFLRENQFVNLESDDSQPSGDKEGAPISELPKLDFTKHRSENVVREGYKRNTAKTYEKKISDPSRMPQNIIRTKTTKLKDLFVMAKNIPYELFKEQDSATLKTNDFKFKLDKMNVPEQKEQTIEESSNEESADGK